MHARSPVLDNVAPRERRYDRRRARRRRDLFAFALILILTVGCGVAVRAAAPLTLGWLAPKPAAGAGLKAAAESIAIPASVVVAAELFLPRFSYRGVFVLLAGAILIALFILIRYVRPPLPILGVPAQRHSG